MTIEELKNSSIKDTLYSNYDMFSPLIISMLKNNEITYANFAEFVVHIDRNNTLVTYLRNITEIHDILADLILQSHYDTLTEEYFNKTLELL